VRLLRPDIDEVAEGNEVMEKRDRPRETTRKAAEGQIQDPAIAERWKALQLYSGDGASRRTLTSRTESKLVSEGTHAVAPKEPQWALPIRGARVWSI
jgi:hypothetical protein